MKRSLIILTVIVMYVFGVSYGLMYLPFENPPALLKSLLTKSSLGVIAWMIIRQKIVVLLIGGLLAYFLILFNKKTAQINAVVIGALSVLLGVFFQWGIFRAYDISIGSITGIEFTDYLAIGLTIPVFVAVIGMWSRKIQPPSNQPLEPIR